MLSLSARSSRIITTSRLRAINLYRPCVVRFESSKAESTQQNVQPNIAKKGKQRSELSQKSYERQDPGSSNSFRRSNQGNANASKRHVASSSSEPADPMVVNFFRTLKVGSMDEVGELYSNLKSTDKLSFLNEAQHASIYWKLSNRRAPTTFLDEICQDLKQKGVTIRPELYHDLLYRFAEERNEDRAFQIFTELMKTEAKKDSKTYNSMMNMYRRQKQPQKAIEVYELAMKNVSEIRVLQRLGALCYSTLGKIDDAVSILKDYIDKSDESKLNKAYTNLVAVYVENGRPEEGLKVIEEMKSKSIPLSDVTYRIEFDAFMLLDKPKEARESLKNSVECYDYSRRRSQAPFAADIIRLMDTYLAKDDTSGALEALRLYNAVEQHMSKYRRTVWFQPYQQLMTQLVENEDFEGARSIFDMIITGKKWQYQPFVDLLKKMGVSSEEISKNAGDNSGYRANDNNRRDQKRGDRRRQ
ncbi:hypothetical protein BKA69DRAFT_1052429 [Paraphysoderma sedebokerense]|nr:hypothetical protein BKA69DRAFT_1052429 [Paraphysoderma sedebokerense]